MEFEIGYVDYNVVGSMDNNVRSVEKDEAFGQHTDLFRESWGLPNANAIRENNSNNEESEVNL